MSKSVAQEAKPAVETRISSDLTRVELTTICGVETYFGTSLTGRLLAARVANKHRNECETCAWHDAVRLFSTGLGCE